MVADWIYEKNLKPLFEILSQSIEYDFDKSDWVAICMGVGKTNYEQDEWHEYELIGKQTININSAADIGSSVVHVRLESEPDVEEKAKVAIAILQQYQII